MFTPRDPGSLMTIIVVMVAVTMILWRTVIKLTAIGFVALAVYGLLTLFQGLH